MKWIFLCVVAVVIGGVAVFGIYSLTSEDDPSEKERQLARVQAYATVAEDGCDSEITLEHLGLLAMAPSGFRSEQLPRGRCRAS
jgi:hypothetical protein